MIVGNFTAATNATFDQDLLIFKTNGGSPIKSAGIEEAAISPTATPPEDYPQSSTLIIHDTLTRDSTTTNHNRHLSGRHLLRLHRPRSRRLHLFPHLLLHTPPRKGGQKDESHLWAAHLDRY